MDEIDQALAPVREAYREWRAQYEAEASAAFAALDDEARMKVTFHLFRMLARDVGTYRYLIYDKLGFGMEAYGVLMDGLDINNALFSEGERTGRLAEDDKDVTPANAALEEYRRDGGEAAVEWFARPAGDPPADDQPDDK